MHLETLRLFCDVVRLRSFSRGAAQNFVSQSAASQAVQQLERELGVRLIDRTKRPFAVTAEGDMFYNACRGLLETWEKARVEVAAVKARVDGTVRVAAIYSVGLHDMSHHLQRFMALYPNARVQLECLHPHKVVDAVLNDEADVGVMSYPPAERALSVVPLRSEPMAFVCHPNHRLGRRRTVAPGDLNGEAFVAFDRELTIRKAIDRALRQHNARPNIVMEFDNIETIKQAIKIGAGVSILPRHTVEVGPTLPRPRRGATIGPRRRSPASSVNRGGSSW
ncbi:MAG: LysR family transcriptional regulator [Candidatus Rokubacteria bacterium]|nr:LysR family transcriptional regulator [Candidatus Rokubacteria bacterium]